MVMRKKRPIFAAGTYLLYKMRQIAQQWLSKVARTVALAGMMAVAMGVHAGETTTLTKSVKDFGAVPDDGRDDTKALRKAVEWCRTHEGATLVMAPGKYILRDADAVKLENEAMKGQLGKNPESTVFAPYYPYARGLDFDGCRNVTVEATGATLMCEGWMEPVSLHGCEGLTLRGLIIDYLRKPFAEGVITAIDDETIDVQFIGEAPAEGAPLGRLHILDPKIEGMYRSPYYFPDHERIDQHTLRFHLGRRLPEYLLGTPIAAMHSFHFRPAILIQGCTNTTLDDVTIHSQPGMGIVGFDSKNITLNRLSVVPAEGYHFSTNTDATHFACCEGELNFQNCTFVHQGDDATNVHGYYHNISDDGDGWLRLSLAVNTHASVADVPRVGDKMEIVRINSLEPVTEMTVKEVTHEEGAMDVRVRLDGTLPEGWEQCYAFNITKLPRLTFEGCTVLGNLARGVLAKTRGVTLRGNVFRGCTGTAIHVGAESGWREGTHAHDVLIEDNVMVNCGLGAGCQNGASGIAVVIEAPELEGVRLHENIVVRNNVVVGTGANDCGICVEHARDVVLTGNLVRGCRTDISTKDIGNFKK